MLTLFGYAGANDLMLGEVGERVVVMITFVGRCVLDLLLAAGRLLIDLRLHQVVFQRGRVVLRGVTDFGRQNDLGVEIDDAFCLVGQVRRTAFHAGEAAIGIGRALPLVVGNRLVVAGFIEAPQLVDARLLAGFCEPTLFHQSRQVSVPVLVDVLAHDDLHGGVGF